MKKYVLTGGPSCGKTTVIQELQKRGYAIVPEVAREILEKRKSEKPTPEEWRLRQQLIFYGHEIMEGRLTGEEYFLDRGIIDMLVYSKKLLGENPYPTESIKFRGRYELVFLLDPFPLVDDGIRWEDEKTAREIHEEMNQEYSRFGYSPIRVPIFTASSLEEEINKRADFIINQIN